jgi:hypothetical protein
MWSITRTGTGHFCSTRFSPSCFSNGRTQPAKSIDRNGCASTGSYRAFRCAASIAGESIPGYVVYGNGATIPRATLSRCMAAPRRMRAVIAAMGKANIVITRTGLTSKPTCQTWGTNVDANEITEAYEIAISSFAALSIRDSWQDSFRLHHSSICPGVPAWGS